MTSRYGVVAMASSTDVMGCFTHTAEDAELVLSVMAGKDARDMTTLGRLLHASNFSSTIIADWFDKRFHD